jgi:two-component system, NarL family, sensor histidine kinase UhpB
MENPAVFPALNELTANERMRLTRELHDLEQSLAILSVQMLRAGKMVSGLPGTVHPGPLELSGKLKEISERVRRLSHELHSSRFKYCDLAEAGRKYCQEFADKHNIPVEYHCQDIPSDLDGLLALTAIRVIQEALDNAAKHSRAKLIQVVLRGTAKEIALRIDDDGVGFDVEEAKLAQGLGLISMRERITLTSGDFAVSSKRGQGTHISARVPLQRQSASTAG